MNCCATGLAIAEFNAPSTLNDEIRLASRRLDAQRYQTDLSVPGIHCGACIRVIENALGKLPQIERARVNLSTKRVTVQWQGNDSPRLIETLAALGYPAHLHEVGPEQRDETLRELVRALAVSGFAANNIMLLSVSVWAGAEPATRDLFHWLSAAIALPTLVYAGHVFFRSAWNALRHGRTNMDVPISIGVLLAFAISLYETAHAGEHAYFDASVSLLFFLLIGRTLDHLMRNRARTAVAGLARLAARGALVQRGGHTEYLPVDEIECGMTILLAAGDRVPVNGRVVSGQSDIDCSLVSGESLPQAAGPGAELQAGTLNLTGPLTVAATSSAKDSFLAEMLRLMEVAENGCSAHRRIADRAAQLYAPVVHLAAFLTFLGWMAATGDVHRAITVAIAVLIITCPCALGLAVPMVQVVAAARLFEFGIMLKDGAALERLAEVDSIVFDKTGTLTVGAPSLVKFDAVSDDAIDLAAALAAHSRHPYSRAIAAVRTPAKFLPLNAIREVPGCGIEYDGRVRLGRPEWALRPGALASMDGANVVLSRDGRYLGSFCFEDRLRAGAREAKDAFVRNGFTVRVLSGDREATVRELAASLGVAYTAEMTPAGKVAEITAMGQAGRKVLMVGDGLNDAPALAAAHVSIAPASGADVGRQAADLVFLHESLTAVTRAFEVAHCSARLIRQNIALSIAYNAIAVPIAVLGYVTPLIAAIAMSLSSIIVIANALRLRGSVRFQSRKQSDRSAAARPMAIGVPG